MVNTEDEEEPKDKQFNVDGTYVPRIFFIGKLIHLKQHKAELIDLVYL